MSENKFTYYGITSMPEIPCVTDIMFAFGYVSEGKLYASCHTRFPKYLENVHLAAAACICEICSFFSEKNTSTAEKFMQNAKLVIAKTIIKMAPDSVPGNHPSLVEAHQILAE